MPFAARVFDTHKTRINADMCSTANAFGKANSGFRLFVFISRIHYSRLKPSELSWSDIAYTSVQISKIKVIWFITGGADVPTDLTDQSYIFYICARAG
jgi:hypothetical protein